MVYLKKPWESIRHFYYSHKSIKKCIKILACPFCCVCYTIENFSFRCGKVRADKKKAERAGALSSIAQRRRERALKSRKRSPSVDRSKWGRKRLALDQDQSPLFGKLPAELRVQIYEMVFRGPGRLHIRFQPTRYEKDKMRLTSYSCPEGYNCNHGPCHSSIPRQDIYCRYKRLSVLQCCKRAYREAINLLYSVPVLEFYTNDEFKIFSRSVLPQRLKQIRQVVIRQTSDSYMYTPLRYMDAEFVCTPGDSLAILTSMSRLSRVDLEMQSEYGRWPSRTWRIRPLYVRTLIRVDGGWALSPADGDHVPLSRVTDGELFAFVHEDPTPNQP